MSKAMFGPGNSSECCEKGMLGKDGVNLYKKVRWRPCYSMMHVYVSVIDGDDDNVSCRWKDNTGACRGSGQ